MKKLAINHKDIINPVISSIKCGASKGITKLAQAAQDKIDNNINTIEGGALKRRRGRPKKGEGLIGDALKGLITMSGVGAKPRKPRAQKGKGIGFLLGPLVKAVAPSIIDAVAGAAKKKMGTGAKKAGRPRKKRTGRA